MRWMPPTPPNAGDGHARVAELLLLFLGDQAQVAAEGFFVVPLRRSVLLLDVSQCQKNIKTVHSP